MKRAALLISCLLLSLRALASAPIGGEIPLPPERPLGLSDQKVVTPPQTPLPPERPIGFGKDQEPLPPSQSPAVSAQDGECESLTASGRVTGRVEPPVVGPGGCGIAAPILLSGIVLSNGAPVAVRPPALMRCSFASALADWVRKDLAPAASASGDQLSVIDDEGAYECRTRDGVAGAKLSEHGKGDAIDISALDSQNGSFFEVSKHPDTALAHEFRDSACRRFTTVLGPGADSYHTSHVHLDLEPRLHSRFCQWTLR